MQEDEAPDLKLRTARTLKWNVLDRISSQVLYAVTGIILAKLLSKEDFGLVGAVLIFQAFASLLVDSGFSYALIQRKHPTRLEYSSVLWFNLLTACGLYIILWFAAPLIAMCFDNDQRLIPLSRVMFLTFILNASAIVQTNRLVKKMDVKLVAIANLGGMVPGAIIGIWMAFAGYGAWAIVWQSIVIAGGKSGILWLTSKWLPVARMSFKALKGFMSVGSGMMATSFLNTVFQYIYNFFIGNRTGLVSLAYYTQADKWSKMGISSLSQILTSSFLPALSHVQDESERFARIISKMNKFTAYILFPSIALLVVIATPIFHLLFNTKWDASIALFQLLLIRGVFLVFCSLYNNYIVALGKAGVIVKLEFIRDGLTLAALMVTFPFMGLSTPEDIVLGLKILVYGQVASAALSWAVTLWYTSKVTGIRLITFISDIFPYFGISLIFTTVIAFVPYSFTPAIDIIVQSLMAAAIYIGFNKMLRSKVQREVIGYITHRFKSK